MSEVHLKRFANVLAIVILNIEQFFQRNYKTIKKYFLKEKINQGKLWYLLESLLMSGISWSWISFTKLHQRIAFWELKDFRN
jgi:hypothetical protein